MARYAIAEIHRRNEQQRTMARMVSLPLKTLCGEVGHVGMPRSVLHTQPANGLAAWASNQLLRTIVQASHV
jgi:hypothetical protein